MYEEEQFPFEEVVEEQEELDFNKLRPCPHCKKPIPVNAITCLYCGEEVTGSRQVSWVVWVAIFVVIVFLIMVVIQAG